MDFHFVSGIVNVNVNVKDPPLPSGGAPGFGPVSDLGNDLDESLSLGNV